MKLHIIHDEDYDPASHFVWYFDDTEPEPDEVFVVFEDWD
jgi:hypothetical protein